MRFGLQVPVFTYPGGPTTIRPVLKNIAQAADAGGFYSLWTMDHFFQMEMIGGPEREMLEGYSTLSYFAALTERVKLGTLVTGVIYRHPGLLVKTVTTLDVLSGGRAYLGIGAAWYEREALGLGVPYPDTTTRFEQLEETLQIAHQMWSDEVKPYHGKHFTLEEARNVPNALTKPHPPILIGGTGEQKTMRMIAKYGDACNFFAQMGNEVMRQKLDALKARCEEAGRDYAEIEKTALGSVNLEQMSAKDIVEWCRGLAALGFQHIIVNLPNAEAITPIETLAREVIPEIAAL